MTTKDYPGDLGRDIEQYECGHMTVEESLVFFQRLIDCGRAWTLPGAYGRHAEKLIEVGLCKLPADQ